MGFRDYLILIQRVQRQTRYLIRCLNVPFTLWSQDLLRGHWRHQNSWRHQGFQHLCEKGGGSRGKILWHRCFQWSLSRFHEYPVNDCWWTFKIPIHGTDTFWRDVVAALQSSVPVDIVLWNPWIAKAQVTDYIEWIVMNSSISYLCYRAYYLCVRS